MAHRSEDNGTAYWLEVLRSDIFWLLGVFLFLNYRFIQTQIREVVSRPRSPNGRLDTRVEDQDGPGKKPTTEVPEYTYKYVGLARLRHDIKTRSMMIVVSCLVIPLLALECCWVYLFYCQLVELLLSLSLDDPWKPYLLWIISLFLETALSMVAGFVWMFLAARLLKVQVSYIRALVNLPISPNGSKARESRSESPAPQQPLAPPNSPEVTLSETSSSALPPQRTPESTSSALPPSPKVASLRRLSSPTAASFVEAVEAVEQLSPGSPPSLSPRRLTPENITSADEVDYHADQSAPTTSLAALVPSQASPLSPKWWDLVLGSSTTPDMPPATSPRLSSSTTSSPAPTSVQQDSKGYDVAAYVEDAPMERPSIPVPSRTFREPVSTNTARLSDQRTRNWSTASDPGSYSSRRCT